MSPDQETTTSATDAFLLHWHSQHGDVDLRAFLEDRSTLSHHEQLDVILTDQRVRWKLGHGRTVNEYLADFPMLASEPSFVTDLVYGDWLAHNKSDAPAVPDAIEQLLESVREKISTQLDVHRWACDEAVRLTESSDLIVRIERQSANFERLSQPEPTTVSLPQSSLGGWSMSRKVGVGILGAAFAASVAMMIALWQYHVPSDASGSTSETSIAKLQEMVEPSSGNIKITWAADAFRSGDLRHRERITATPAALQGGDALRVTVRSDKPAHLYLYTIDPLGKAVFVGSQPPSHKNLEYQFPEQADQVIPVPNLHGTMVCVVVLRDQPVEDPVAIAAQLRVPKRLPALGTNMLLVDGAPLTSGNQDSLEGDGNIGLGELRNRLVNQYASRAIGPADPLGDQAFADAIKTWYEQIPDSVGDVHYLAIPVVTDSQ